MSDVIVVGGGPAGLQAALLTAKNGLDTTVFDTGESSVNGAYLKNYLGIDEMSGLDFLENSREQVERHGADIEEREVERVEQTLDGFDVVTGHTEFAADYVVLATGYDRELASDLGCEFDADDTVTVDFDYETTVDDVYAVGWTARPEKIQVAISVGAGASAALDVLSKERGEPYHDFDYLSEETDQGEAEADDD